MTGGKARWFSDGAFGGLSYEMTRAARRVLLGSDPPVVLTARARDALAELRDDSAETVSGDGTVVRRDGDDVRWWTWAGFRTNATLAASLADVVDPVRRFTDQHLPLRSDLSPEQWDTVRRTASETIALPRVDEKALKGLKFSDALPESLAVRTLATRLADPDRAAEVLAEPTQYLTR